MSKEEQNAPQMTTLSAEFAPRSLAEFTTAMEYLANPDELLREQGGRLDVYRRMRDCHFDAVRQTRFAAITSRPWKIEGEDGDVEKAKFVENYLWNLDMRDTILQMLGALDYGYAVHELVYDAVDTDRGRLILPTRIVDRKQEWFKFDENGALLFQTKNSSYLPVPQYKFIVTRNKATSFNPYGEAIRSNCFWPLAFKKGGTKFWAIFIEKFGMPKALGKGPSSMTEAEQNKFLKNLYRLVRDAVAVIPQTGTVELIESKTGTGATPQQAFIEWTNAEMSKAWLGETLTTEQTGSGGTQAMATVHNDVRGDLTKDDAAMVEKSVNGIIRDIWALNWPDEAEIPWMNIILPEDLQAGRVERDVKLATSLGVRFNKAYVADTYGIDQKYFDIVDVPQGAPGAAFGEGEEHEKMSPGDLRKNVNDMVAGLASEDLQDQVEEMAKPIVELAEHCGTYAEFEKALNKALPDIGSKKLEDSVTKCLLLAEMAGRSDG